MSRLILIDRSNFNNEVHIMIVKDMLYAKETQSNIYVGGEEVNEKRHKLSSNGHRKIK